MNIPDIPKDQIERVVAYADHTNHWIDSDVGVDKNTSKKHSIKVDKIDIRYFVAFKNDEEDNTIGELPYRCLAIKFPANTYSKEEMNDFVERSLEVFGFEDPIETIGKNGTLHYHEELFQI